MMRIDKLLSNLQYGSRSDIKKAIKDKRIHINTTLCRDAGQWIDPIHDEILFDGEKVIYESDVTIMMNKPQGFECSHQSSHYPPVFELLSDSDRRYPFEIAGRLDQDTEGFVLMTTNGQLLHQIISPKKQVFKTYFVETKHEIQGLDRLNQGVDIFDHQNQTYRTLPAKTHLLDSTHCEIAIQEGKYHQVKRMFEAIQNEVIYLKRIQIGALPLDSNLEIGTYRRLTKDEIALLFQGD